MSNEAPGNAPQGNASASQGASEPRRDAEPDTTQLNVEIPTELHRRLKMYSARTGRPMKQVVTEILDMNLGA
jgi:predicted HicB family RNase H-like nuclease